MPNLTNDPDLRATRTEYVEVLPAYGRDYKSAKAAKAAWDEGLDFMEATSRRYCSKRDFAGRDVVVTIRYADQRRLASTR